MDWRSTAEVDRYQTKLAYSAAFLFCQKALTSVR